jgi:hypothetical protein
MRALCSKIRSALASPPPEGVAEIGAFAIAEPDRDILGRDLRLTQIFDRQTHTNVVENFTVRRVLFLEVAMQLPGAQAEFGRDRLDGRKMAGNSEQSLVNQRRKSTGLLRLVQNAFTGPASQFEVNRISAGDLSRHRGCGNLELIDIRVEQNRTLAQIAIGRGVIRRRIDNTHVRKVGPPAEEVMRRRTTAKVYSKAKR